MQRMTKSLGYLYCKLCKIPPKINYNVLSAYRLMRGLASFLESPISRCLKHTVWENAYRESIICKNGTDDFSYTLT